MEKHDTEQADAQQPLQLALTVDTAPVSQPENSDGTYDVPAVSDVESHWREVNKLTKALRKRGRVSRRITYKATSQKSLWLPSEANGQKQDRREVGLQVCRHLVAALRLQHQQELSEREASNASEAQRSA
ncbi:MAG: hypothetical protein L7S71_05960 [Pseudomonadales bacterium]|jgi:hypothetical protein|nr:hypothetical protein [Gammaproteobacteria bacterium]MCH1597766.1 hypothetical protein [Pseudomonadales bacterium]RPG29934.1 MAG: hypothetical protein CBE03_011120 [Gammaproteobacteria bacterium TMED243]